jgi:predicted Rossmann fold nucleotide-binding protein DprA/Smf involved in DNA uptake
MSEYTVTLQLKDKAQFLHFVDTVGPVAGQLVITVAPESEASAPQWNEQPAQKPAKARQRRGSKVNNTVLRALDQGPQSVKALKEALEHAGMSPGSLSTGIAALTKARQIERESEGVYRLAQAA